MDYNAMTQSGNTTQTAASQTQAFLKATYLHLAGAVAACALLSYGLWVTGVSQTLLKLIAGAGTIGAFAMMGGFMLVAYWATRMANDDEADHQKQLMGLGIYVVLQSGILAPMLAMASYMAPDAIGSAALMTAMLVAGLTWTAFNASSDFSFLRQGLRLGFFVVLGLIIASLIFGFELGVWFSGAMIVFAGGSVLYDTAQIIHHYPRNRPAGAALHLFASIAMLFYYVLRLLMQLSGRD